MFLIFVSILEECCFGKYKPERIKMYYLSQFLDLLSRHQCKHACWFPQDLWFMRCSRGDAGSLMVRAFYLPTFLKFSFLICIMWIVIIVIVKVNLDDICNIYFKVWHMFRNNNYYFYLKVYKYLYKSLWMDWLRLFLSINNASFTV